MAENEKRYPVYRWHLIEVYAVQKLAEKLRDHWQEQGPKDKYYVFLLWFCGKLGALAESLGAASGDVVMFNREDRIFIEKICTWLKKNPEVLAA